MSDNTHPQDNAPRRGCGCGGQGRKHKARAEEIGPVTEGRRDLGLKATGAQGTQGSCGCGKR